MQGLQNMQYNLTAHLPTSDHSPTFSASTGSQNYGLQIYRWKVRPDKVGLKHKLPCPFPFTELASIGQILFIFSVTASLSEKAENHSFRCLLYHYSKELKIRFKFCHLYIYALLGSILADLCITFNFAASSTHHPECRSGDGDEEGRDSRVQ